MEVVHAVVQLLSAMDADSSDEDMDSSSHDLEDKTSQLRLQEHCCHYKSNFLMHLIEAICHVEFPNKFHWDQYVVARLYDPPQAPVGEILLSRLADGYIASGVGLSFWNAGQNNHSAEIFNHGQLKEFHHRTLYDSMFLVNSNWEHEREVEEKACIEVHRKLREEEERKKLRQETHLGFVWYHTMEDLDCMGTVVWPDRT